ncbi:MAG: inositol monophosphatase family protein, partial [Patescibacteria group bacterium]
MQLTGEKLLMLENEMVQIMKDETKILASSWKNIQQINLKNERDIVTKLDVTIEENVRKRLSLLLPEAGFIVEEGLSNKSADYNWLIDPIDGTKEFAHHTPLFVSQICLMYKDEPICAVIYNPLTDQCFSASKNNGARVNEESVQIKFHRNLS